MSFEIQRLRFHISKALQVVCMSASAVLGGGSVWPSDRLDGYVELEIYIHVYEISELNIL